MGLHDSLAKEIIKILEPHGSVHITSERPIAPELEQYRIQIDPLLIHHALAFASLFIGDSQTMTAEAAILGTPALRFNDFAGKISLFEELEDRYQLSFGFHTSQSAQLLDKIKDLLLIDNLKHLWKERQEKMLNEKIDVTMFMVDFFEKFNSH